MIKRKINNLKQDFKFLRDNKEIVYLNSSATSLKPDIFVERLSDLYKNNITSFGKSSYISEVDIVKLYENTLIKVANHIKCNFDEILPTYGTTDFLNKIASKIINSLKDGDEIILGELEHASNILCWTSRAKELNKKIIFKWYKLDNWKIDYEHLKTLITSKTKVMSVAHVFNTSGTINNLVKIRETIGKEILLVVDGAQAIGHMPINVKESNLDYYVFGAHKAFGSHALGFAYIKNLKDIETPWTFGGGNNQMYTKDSVDYKIGKSKFIAGTRDVPGVISFSTSIDYIESFGEDNILKYNENLKKYAESKLSTLTNVKIINKGANSSNIFFEIKGVSGEDVAYHLANDGIIVRSGSNCVKIKNKKYEQHKAIRASFHIYNTTEDIDKLYESLKNGGDFLGALFHKRPTPKICE